MCTVYTALSDEVNSLLLLELIAVLRAFLWNCEVLTVNSNEQQIPFLRGIDGYIWRSEGGSINHSLCSPLHHLSAFVLLLTRCDVQGRGGSGWGGAWRRITPRVDHI